MAEDATSKLQTKAADLLSEIRNSCRTSQRAIDTLVEGIDCLIQLYLEVLKNHFHKELSSRDGYLNINSLNSVIESFKDQSVFEGLQSCSEFESYLRETSGGEDVVLSQVVVESKTVIRNGVPKRAPSKFGYVVPFLPQLEQVLNLPDVLYCIDNPRPSVNGVYRTLTDGLFYKYHPVVLKHGSSTIVILVHMDDADPCDPLKAKANKNNLRLVYWTIGNIYPELRSSLRAINLLAIVKAKIAKEKGNDFLFQDFITAMQRLGTEGVEFNINGVKRRFYAILLFGSLDNPAAANLGGFKETHSALHPCRNCLVKSSEMCEDFQESVPLLRKLEDHEKYVKQVTALSQKDDRMEVRTIVCREGVEANEDEVMNVVDYKTASKEFGVNGPSPLSEVPHFDVTKCLPQDLMHVLSEGIVENVCRLILKDLCLPPAPRVKPILPLEHLNKLIETTCDFGHLKANRPSVIEKGHITGSKLKQSAAQMMVLMRLLPFATYNRLPEEKHNLLLKLIGLVDRCVAYESTDADAELLGNIIEDFGRSFKKIYPNHKSLKLHCLVHLKTQLKLFGPLRQHWCFRYEAMHYEFTSIFPVVRSMKNPALTAAVRHLSARNTQIKQGKEGGNYLSCSDVISGCEDVFISSLPDMETILKKFPSLHGDSKISKVNRIVSRGSEWHTGVIFLLDKENHIFGRINNVYSLDNMIMFTYNILQTSFCAEYNAFEIFHCGHEDYAVLFTELQYKFPIPRFSFAFKRRFRAFLLMQGPVDTY